MSDIVKSEKKKVYERYYRQTRPEIKRRIQHTYYESHKEEHKKRCSKWARQHKVNGITVSIPKRPYPENGACELCGRKGKRLGYHHWDDERRYIGIWCCMRCHRMCHTVDGWEVDEAVVTAYKELRSSL
jgi:hypothetical protein